jgi:hypothetical protein
LLLFTDQIEAIFGDVGYTNPVFILAVYSPGIAGVYWACRRIRLARRGTAYSTAPFRTAVGEPDSGCALGPLACVGIPSHSVVHEY